MYGIQYVSVLVPPVGAPVLTVQLQEAKCEKNLQRHEIEHFMIHQDMKVNLGIGKFKISGCTCIQSPTLVKTK